MIQIKQAAKMWAFRVSVTDKSVGRKWGLESKHQDMLRCDGGAGCATRTYNITATDREGFEVVTVRNVIQKHYSEKENNSWRQCYPMFSCSLQEAHLNQSVVFVWIFSEKLYWCQSSWQRMAQRKPGNSDFSFYFFHSNISTLSLEGFWWYSTALSLDTRFPISYRTYMWNRTTRIVDMLVNMHLFV